MNRKKTIYEMTDEELEEAHPRIEELAKTMKDKRISEMKQLKAVEELLDYFLPDLEPV